LRGSTYCYAINNRIVVSCPTELCCWPMGLSASAHVRRRSHRIRLSASVDQVLKLIPRAAFSVTMLVRERWFYSMPLRWQMVPANTTGKPHENGHKLPARYHSETRDTYAHVPALKQFPCRPDRAVGYTSPPIWEVPAAVRVTYPLFWSAYGFNHMGRNIIIIITIHPTDFRSPHSKLGCCASQ